MRNTLLGVAAGAMALAISAEAGACSLVPREPDRPFYAQLVRGAAYIDIVTVVSVEPISSERDTYSLPRAGNRRVLFSSSESIKGGQPTRFSFEYFAYDPSEVDETNLAPFQEEQPVREPVYNDSVRNHEDLDFWVGIDIYDIPVDPACTIMYPDFQPGETYLIFRDADGRPVSQLDAFGRNFQPVESEDDEFLEAVRRLNTNPDLQYGRSMTAMEFIDRLFVAAEFRAYACGNGDIRTELLPLGNGFVSQSFDGTQIQSPDTHYWSVFPFFSRSEVCYSADNRSKPCSDVQDACELDFRALVLPTSSYPFANGRGGTHYGETGIEISTDGRLLLDEFEAEIEIAGETRPLFEDVLSWLSDTEETDE